MNASSSSWTVRGATFAVWLLAAGSCVYWGLKLSAGAAAPAPAAALRGVAAADPAAIARMLGTTASAPLAAAPAAPPLASRFALVGVVAGVESRQGAALISVDGKPPRPYRVGAAVDESLIVQAVEGRRAVLGPQGGAAAVTLELPLQGRKP